MRVVWRAEALQELFFSPLGAGAARAEWRNKDSWGDVVSPNPSLRKVSTSDKQGAYYESLLDYRSYRRHAGAAHTDRRASYSSCMAHTSCARACECCAAPCG